MCQFERSANNYLPSNIKQNLAIESETVECPNCAELIEYRCNKASLAV